MQLPTRVQLWFSEKRTKRFEIEVAAAPTAAAAAARLHLLTLLNCVLRGEEKKVSPHFKSW